MIIKSIKLKNFRNYENLDLEFNDRLNIIIGNNAQGKTNILESIYFLSLSKSFINSHDDSLIMKDMEFSRVNGTILRNDGKYNLSIILNNLGKNLKIGENKVKKSSEYIGNLKVVIFSPSDVRIIKDSPSVRRKFLNIEISQLYKKYIVLLNEYNMLLRQRNEYLKIVRNKDIDYNYLDVIDAKFVDLSYEIYLYRKKFINLLNDKITDIYNSIFDDGSIFIKYISDVELEIDDKIKNDIFDKLRKNLNKDIIYGNTSIGPHRDDFMILRDNMDVSLYGSQGQIKGVTLSLKLAEIDIFKDICGEYPVILLDDIFSELDISKQNKLISFLNRELQIIITTTDIVNIDKKFVKDAMIYTINEGKIIKMEGDKNGRES